MHLSPGPWNCSVSHSSRSIPVQPLYQLGGACPSLSTSFSLCPAPSICGKAWPSLRNVNIFSLPRPKISDAAINLSPHQPASHRVFRLQYPDHPSKPTSVSDERPSPFHARPQLTVSQYLRLIRMLLHIFAGGLIGLLSKAAAQSSSSPSSATIATHTISVGAVCYPSPG